MELFLSHATADATLVQHVKMRLEPLGVKVYAAEHDNRAGENVHAKIEEAIQRCDLVVVLLTQAGHDSRYVHQEIGYARRAGRLTIPLVTEAARHDLGMLEGLEYIVIEEGDPSDALDQLGARVRDVISKRQEQNELIMVGLILVALGVIIWSIGEG